MKTLEMEGPFELTDQKIEETITKTSPGNYALGYLMDRKFYVEYVGRSDENLNKGLKEWVNKHKRFKFSYANSDRTAFEKECKNYHDFGGEKTLVNKSHPTRPNEASWLCPYCKIYK